MFMLNLKIVWNMCEITCRLYNYHNELLKCNKY